MTSSPSRGVILFAHGSRDPLWHRPIQQVAERVRALDPDVVVACAYLELTEPDLPTCAAQMIAQGLQAITVVPVLLGVGKHAREDLPQLMQALYAQHPAVQFRLQPAVGENEQVIDLLARVALT